MSPDVHPLLFDPILKPKIWGGRRLASVLGKTLPDRVLVGESWELSDLPGNESVVRAGPCKGRSLRQLVQEWGSALLGRAKPVDGRFPLLIKFLDAAQDLSVQVHPSEHVAATEPDAHLKNEAWYVIAAEPDAAIYHGLAAGVTREQFADALRRGDVESLLRRVPARAGDSFYLPSGTVHALGAGVLVAEVQTPSDTTYRLFDWNRVDASTGRPRELHVESALRCIDFASPSPPPQQERTHVASLWVTVTRLASCKQFRIEKVRMVEGADQAIPYAEPVIWMMLDGRAEVAYGGGRHRVEVGRGDVLLLPAALGDGQVRVGQAATWLEVTIPTPSDLADYDRPSPDALREPSAAAGATPVSIHVPPGLKQRDTSADS